ncbi:MAG: PASTA domain-containing protein [Phycisphaerales bacterium]|nr:PASTA domain-containing protein [Phycisphaerales bacterium]
MHLKKIFYKFWFHVVLVVMVSILLVIIFFATLPLITKSHSFIRVPNVVGVNTEVATSMLTSMGFDVQVLDSIYDPKYPKLGVVQIYPAPGSLVKVGRIVNITINKPVPPMVNMPNLKSSIYKTAILLLHNANLNLGDTFYRDGDSKNIVLDQIINGQSVLSGSPVPLGSKVDLVLGSGRKGRLIGIPQLVGLSLYDALNLIRQNGFNVGSIIPLLNNDISLKNIIVTGQSESPFLSDNKTVNMAPAGTPIDVYVSVKKSDN